MTATHNLTAEQAVLIYLDALTLPDNVYDAYNLNTLEDQLIEVLDETGAGVLDGNEFGPGETVLFLHGPDAERLYASIEETLRRYPLCQNARVQIRAGNLGAEAREVRLPRR